VMVVYGSWQDLRTQMIANYMGRAQGQTRVAGGASLGNSSQAGSIMSENFSIGRSFTQKAGGFLNYKDLKFDLGESSDDGVKVKFNFMFDQVSIKKTPRPPAINLVGFKYKPELRPFEARAYGGEDTLMYALPRWQGYWKTYQRSNWKSNEKYNANDF